jgi:hypothetical protein
MLHTAQLLIRLKVLKMKTALLMMLITLTGPMLLTGCSLIDIRPRADINNSPVSKQKVFFAHYDNVWRAAHASLKYPIAQENQDTGIIETEYIKGVDGWLPPTTIKPPSSGVRYKLLLTFAKGTTEGRESTRVTMEKNGDSKKLFLYA